VRVRHERETRRDESRELIRKRGRNKKFQRPRKQNISCTHLYKRAYVFKGERSEDSGSSRLNS